jgi:hypothetical protein
MDKSRPSDARSSHVGGLSRRRSLLWLVRESVARRLSWLIVVLVCILPLIVIAAITLSRSAARDETRLSRLLSERLGVPVELRLIRRDALGQYGLSGVVIREAGSAGPTLQANRGVYQAPRPDLPGLLALEAGTFSMDLGTWTKPPGRQVMRMLHNVENSTDLRCLSLSDFTAQLRLGGEVVALRSVIGRVELTEEGEIHGTLTGKTERGRLGATLEIADARHVLTVVAKPLPWAKGLVEPALGETLSRLLEPSDGKLTLTNLFPDDYSPRSNWKLDASTVLDLGRLPREIGLGDLTGKLGVKLNALGRLGEPPTLRAALALPDNTTGTLTPAALRNLNFLLSGQWGLPVFETKPLTFSAVNLSLTVTRDEIRIEAADKNLPAGIFAPGGVQLLSASPGPIPLSKFLERLEELGRRYRENRLY